MIRSLFFVAVTASVVVLPAVAEQVDIKATIKKQKKYGPYVGVFAGVNDQQTAAVSGTDFPLAFRSDEGGPLIGIEIGYAWKTKYYLEPAIEFEAFYLSNELAAATNPGETANVLAALEERPEAMLDNQTLGFVTDMHAMAFMVNASVTLDLERLKPWVPHKGLANALAAFRPYVGAGVGGAQLWFRNTRTASAKEVNDFQKGLAESREGAEAEELAMSTPDVFDVLDRKDTSGSVTPVSDSITALFSEDKFVFAWQWFAGLELNLSEKFGIYGEYREVTFDKFDEVKNYQNQFWNAGIRIRY